MSDTFVNFLLICEANSLSTYTEISLSVTKSVTSKYLSITLNTIVSVLLLAFFVDDTLSIFGFIKSTCPNVNCCLLLVLFDSSFNVSAAISIFVVPLHSKNCFPDCFVLSSQFESVNVYLTPY